MSNVEHYKKQILKTILDAIQPRPDVLAAWEGGSAATGTVDQFSDIDLCILSKAPIQSVIETVQAALEKYHVIHTWQTAKSFWGDGMAQRIIVLKDAPKYFFIDVGVFDANHPQLVKDFLEVERHGQPIILFDKTGTVKSGHTDAVALFDKQMIRAEELKRGFVIFKTLVQKEIERGNRIDALGFYQTGLLGPAIEVLGMLRRPFKYDFGMRYIHKSFPKDEQTLIEELSYVSNFEALPEKLNKIEKAFNSAVAEVQKRKSL